MTLVKSVYDSQEELLDAVMGLHFPDGLDADLTYGNGAFYKRRERPTLAFDISPQTAGVIAACSTRLPLQDECISGVVFDPPFLTYVRAGRNGNGNMAMAKRFAGYWRYEELEAHYVGTIKEVARVLKKGGRMLFKCQDIIHNHKMHCTHASVIGWAAAEGLRLKDLFILAAKHRMPSPNRGGKQRHARIFHSYFLVLEK